MAYRLIIAVDVEADDLPSAYSLVYRFMGTVPAGMDWESTDEAYAPDGEVIDADMLQTARMAFFAEQHDK
jgi:hypothetical protein